MILIPHFKIVIDEMPTEAVALQSLFPGQSLGHAHQAQQNLESALTNAGLPAAPTIPQVRVKNLIKT